MADAGELKDYRRRIQRIKDNVSMTALVKHYGGSVYDESRSCQIRCPVQDHDDIHPSCRIFHDSNKVQCFSCGFRGDVIDLVEKNEKCDKLGAIQYLEREFELDNEALPARVKTGWDKGALERNLEEDLYRQISDRLWFLHHRIPKQKRYVWWIWNEWIYELYDNREVIGGMLAWHRMARNCIDKYLVPLSKEIDELIFHGIK